MAGHLFGRTILSLAKALDAYALRQRVIADNIANVATPGFRAKEVTFEDQFRRALYKREELRETTSYARHIPIGGNPLEQVRPQIKGSDNTYSNASGVNDVNVDREMAELAKNQLLHMFAAHLLGRKFSGIRASIRGRA